MKKKSLSILSAVVSLSIVATACSSKPAATETPSVKPDSKVETTGITSETGLPIVKDKITIKMISPKSALAPNFGEMSIFKTLEASTNVHIDWNNIPADSYQEKKNLLLASGDLPDAFYNAGFTDFDIVKYGKDGTIVPLEDYIEKDMPNLKKIFEKRPELKKMVTAPDGHIYTLPRAEEMGLVSMPNLSVINKTWLDKLGLQMPTTLEEYHAVLKAFKEKDPNGNGKADEIPLSFWFEGWCGTEADLMALFGLPDVPWQDDHKLVRDGKLIYAPIQPEYKEALAYFNGWVKEGLIDPEVTTQDPPKLFAKGKTKDETLGSMYWWEIEEVVGTDRVKDYAIMPPLKGKDGKTIISRSNHYEYSRDTFVMTKANKNQDVTMKWMDQMYEPKMSAQINWGPIGAIYEEDAKGMLINKKLPDGVAMGEFRQTVAPGGSFTVLKEDFTDIVDMEPRAKQRLADIQKFYAPYMEKENYPQVFMSPEDLKRVNEIETEIKIVVKQKKAHWLMEGGIEKEWDAYLKQLNDMGLQEMLQIYQKALDNFNKK
jgi:putative aldouronate transport system substrate-binding protein